MRSVRGAYLWDERIDDPREERRCRFEITDQDGKIVTMVPRADCQCGSDLLNGARTFLLAMLVRGLMIMEV